MIVAVEESAENRPKAIWSPWGEYTGRISCSREGELLESASVGIHS